MQNETPDFPTRLAACARQLRRHGFEAVCVADLAEAGRRLRDEIARCAPRSISYGDSMTLRATGIVEELRNGSRYEFIDGFDPALPRPEQLEVRRKGLLADFFMTGVNAVTLGGSLYWVDMVGNHRTRDLRAAPRSAAGRSQQNRRYTGRRRAARPADRRAEERRTPHGIPHPVRRDGTLRRLQLAAAHLQLARMARTVLSRRTNSRAADRRGGRTLSLFRTTQRLGQR